MQSEGPWGIENPQGEGPARTTRHGFLCVRPQGALPAMTTTFRMRVLAVDGPRLPLRAAQPYWQPPPPYMNVPEPAPLFSRSLVPSPSLAMGLLLDFSRSLVPS